MNATNILSEGSSMSAFSSTDAVVDIGVDAVDDVNDKEGIEDRLESLALPSSTVFLLDDDDDDDDGGEEVDGGKASPLFRRFCASS
jgi:hypothetical protein